ncbi:uncharacterized protein TNCV_4426431 [Trichonephila clavipes]|nr:uncharacterized protein TNCV_4426431 [Trichonephila clavipes]
MPSLRDGNTTETLLMIAQINTDLVNPLVPLTTESSTSPVRVSTDSCESKINSILHYKDYNSHKNAHKELSGEKKLDLQEVLDLLQNLPSESIDALTEDSLDEEVPANNMISSDS